MEKDIMNQQLITLKNREKFTCELVENVDSFQEDEVVIKTKLGGLNIKGKEMKLSDFSVEDGTLILEGKIDAVVFVNVKEKQSFLKGLFR